MITLRAFPLVLVLLLLPATRLGAQATPSMQSGGVVREVPIASRALPRGATLTARDFTIVPIAVRPSLAASVAADTGWITRRAVAAGEPLLEPAVGRPALVVAGHTVEYVVIHDGIQLSVRGTATTSAARGEHVWVRLDARRRFRGTVVAPGLVYADSVLTTP